MPSPEKFRETLAEFGIDNAVVEKINCGYENVVSKTVKKVKSAYMKQALDVMNAELTPETVKAVIEANACCKSGARLKASKQFAEVHGDLDIKSRLELISSRPYMNMGTAELDGDGSLIVHAVSYYSDGRFECACPTVSHVKRDYSIPREYCYCCGGHFKFHYEIMLGVKLEITEIVSSPHDTDGGQPCVFRYRIVR